MKEFEEFKAAPASLREALRAGVAGVQGVAPQLET
jgi:hypothetical protein